MKTIQMDIKDINNYGMNSIVRLDDKFVEVVTEDRKIKVRTYYTNQDNRGHFYLDNVRYRMNNFTTQVPMKTSDTIEIDFNTNKIIKTETIEINSVKHYQYETIKSCVVADIPVYLFGEAGTGKNFTLQEIAEDMGIDFYFTNSIQQEYKVTGFIDAGGVYHETEFYKAFTKGGMFFLDEMDASIPEVLVLLNAAIANGYFEFPNGKVDAHPDFRVVAAGNTVGTGANELYTGRLVLDSATLDRFVTIEFGYDRNIEMKIANGNAELVNFTRGLRAFCERNGIRATFSYRMIMNITKLEKAGMGLVQILKIAVTKGMDQDTIRTLKTDYSEGSSGRYYYALQELQKTA